MFLWDTGMGGGLLCEDGLVGGDQIGIVHIAVLPHIDEYRSSHCQLQSRDFT